MLKVVENGALREASGELSELDEIARAGARRMLMAALDAEATDYVERHRQERDESGRALVVHNGKGQARKLTLGAGTVELKTPRVNDRRCDEQGQRRRFTSRLTCGGRLKSPRCCPSCTCADSPPVIFVPRSKGCSARMRPVCRRPTSPDLLLAGRKNTPRFASAIWPGASTFTCGSMGCTSTSGSKTTGSAPW